MSVCEHRWVKRGSTASENLLANFDQIIRLRQGDAARESIISSGSGPDRVTVLQLDIQSDDSIRAAGEEVRSKFGRLDVLINNAGKTSPAAGQAPDPRATWRDVLDLNVASQGIVTDEFAPLLKKSTYERRRVIFVSTSISSITNNNDTKVQMNYNQAPYPIYKSSKAALNMLAGCYHMGEFSGTGVATVVACPGFVKTAFAGYIGYKKPEEGGQSIADRVIKGSNEEVDGKFILDDGSLSPW